jgi:4'-phosphopantetheinyl transferase
MRERPSDRSGYRWLALGEDMLPAEEQWLAPDEAATLAGLRYTKRRSEYLLRRLVTKYAVAAVTGRPIDLATLVSIEVRNAASGAPYVCVDGAPLGIEVSITDRAGWAVCVTSPASGHPVAIASAAQPGAAGRHQGSRVGCDLELVEPRTPGFVRDFLTAAEQRLIASRTPGDERDMTANLVWSAKESALKVLRTGLRRDTRTLEVTLAAPRADGWGELTVHAIEGAEFPGWWRRDGRFLLTVAAEVAGPPPLALGDPTALALATPRHTWLDRPLYL